MPRTNKFLDKNLIESTYISNVLLTEFNVLTQQAICFNFCYVSLKTQTMGPGDCKHISLVLLKGIITVVI